MLKFSYSPAPSTLLTELYIQCAQVMTDNGKRLNRISAFWAKDSSWVTKFARQGNIKASLTRRDPPMWGSKCPWRECAPGFLPLHQVPGSCLCGSCSGSRVCHRGADVSTRTGSVSGPGDKSRLVSSFVFRSFYLTALIVGTKMMMMIMSETKWEASCLPSWRTQLTYNMSSVSTAMQFRLGRMMMIIFQGLTFYRAIIMGFK